MKNTAKHHFTTIIHLLILLTYKYCEKGSIFWVVLLSSSKDYKTQVNSLGRERVEIKLSIFLLRQECKGDRREMLNLI
jgi:hypothetical protein